MWKYEGLKLSGASVSTNLDIENCKEYKDKWVGDSHELIWQDNKENCTLFRVHFILVNSINIDEDAEVTFELNNSWTNIKCSDNLINDQIQLDRSINLDHLKGNYLLYAFRKASI